MLLHSFQYQTEKQYQPIQAGWAFDWIGWTCSFTLNRKGLYIGVDETRKTQLKRFKLLPRNSWELAWGHKRYFVRTASLLETISNLKQEKFDWNEVAHVAVHQIKETPSPIEQYQRLFKKSRRKKQVSSKSSSERALKGSAS